MVWQKVWIIYGHFALNAIEGKAQKNNYVIIPTILFFHDF